MPCSQKTRTRDSHHLLKDIWLNRISRAFGFIVTHLNSFSRPRRVVRPAYSLWWLLLCLGCLTLRQKSQKRTRWTCCKRDGTHDQVDVGEEKTELLEISNEKCCGLVLDLFPHLAAPMLAFCSRSWRWSHLWGLSRGSAWAISIGRLQGTFWGEDCEWPRLPFGKCSKRSDRGELLICCLEGMRGQWHRIARYKASVEEHFDCKT